MAVRSIAIAFLAAVLLALIAVASTAGAAQRACGEREKILEQLEQKHQEEPRALGLSGDGGVLEVLVSPKGGWTILISYPKRPTCVVAVGKAWQTLVPLPGDPV